MPTTRSKQAKLEDVVDVAAADGDVKAQAKTSKKGSKTKSSQKRAKKADAAAQDNEKATGSEQDEPKTAVKGRGRGAGKKSAKSKPGLKRKHEDADVTAAEADTTEEPEAAADEAGGEAGGTEQQQQGGRGAAAPAGPGSEEGMQEGEGAEQGGEEAAAEPEAEPEQQAEKQGGEEAGRQQEEEKQTGQQEAKQAVKGSGGSEPGSLPENVVEEGKVSFMFRPRVTTPGSDVDVHSVDDVQRLYLLLEPHQPPGGKCRLLVVPKKTLPDTKKHERFYAFVEVVGSSLSELTGGLGEHTYTTKTRGERLQPAAQPAGEGTYVIAKGGSKNGIHLGFKLSSPSQPGEVQDMLGIKEEGSFVLSAKNPDRGHGPNVPNAGPEAEYSDEQREEFGGRAWIGVEDRSLLDVAGTELLLVGAKENPIQTGELGDAGKVLEEAS